jgi:hypothetical protein
LVHPFEQIFEIVESALPEPGRLACPVDQRGKRAERYGGSGELCAVAHQPGLLQDRKLVRE